MNNPVTDYSDCLALRPYLICVTYRHASILTHHDSSR